MTLTPETMKRLRANPDIERMLRGLCREGTVKLDKVAAILRMTVRKKVLSTDDNGGVDVVIREVANN
jgi:hypothetical protein